MACNCIEASGEDLVTDIDWIRTIMGSIIFLFLFFSKYYGGSMLLVNWAYSH
jgi:hypothetical protein